MKACGRCGAEKPPEEFPKNKYGKGGVHSCCRACHRAMNAEWRANNKEKAATKNLAWQKANPKKVAANSSAWRKAHPEKVTAIAASRNARKLQATPAWNTELDGLVFSEAYALAKARAKSTGIKWHVDHIVPLRSKLVCGLHTPSNIQVLPAVDNIKKGNRYWPNMPQGRM